MGCEAYFPLWRYLFHGRIAKKDGVIRANGGINFQIRPKVSFYYLQLPSKAASEWRKYWFYVWEKQ